MRQIKVIGLTGQTGAGKSTVSALLRGRGIPVIDADEVSREVVAGGGSCLADLALAFSISILHADGTLNRRRLASMVFGDAKKLAKLNSIIFPYIREKIGEKIEALDRQGERMVLLDAPTLFESGADAICDKIVVVTAPERLRLDRIMIRDRLTDEEARKRMSAQQDDAFYTSRADYVIKNAGEESELRMRTLDVLGCLRKDFAL